MLSEPPNKMMVVPSQTGPLLEAVASGKAFTVTVPVALSEQHSLEQYTV
jgi:hypothetical protein